MLLGQCNDSLKYKFKKISDFTKIEDKGIILKTINNIKEEGYGLRRKK